MLLMLFFDQGAHQPYVVSALTAEWHVHESEYFLWQKAMVTYQLASLLLPCIYTRLGLCIR